MLLNYLFFFFPLFSWISIEPRADKDFTYQQLPCSQESQREIAEIIVTMAEKNLIELWANEKHLKELGKHVDYVHPLKFLGFIFSNPQLKRCMREIFESSFKRDGFLEGLAPSMEVRGKKGELEPYLKDFACEVGVSVEKITPLIQKKQWGDFINLLIQP